MQKYGIRKLNLLLILVNLNGSLSYILSRNKKLNNIKRRRLTNTLSQGFRLKTM